MNAFLVDVTLMCVNSSELVAVLMDNVFLHFGLCLFVVIGAETSFMHIFSHTIKGLKIRLHTLSKRNHNAVGVKR